MGSSKSVNTTDNSVTPTFDGQGQDLADALSQKATAGNFASNSTSKDFFTQLLNKSQAGNAIPTTDVLNSVFNKGANNMSSGFSNLSAPGNMFRTDSTLGNAVGGQELQHGLDALGLSRSQGLYNQDQQNNANALTAASNLNRGAVNEASAGTNLLSLEKGQKGSTTTVTKKTSPVMGTALEVVGAVLAPFTGGASLALTAAGAAMNNG